MKQYLYNKQHVECILKSDNKFQGPEKVYGVITEQSGQKLVMSQAGKLYSLDLFEHIYKMGADLNEEESENIEADLNTYDLNKVASSSEKDAVIDAMVNSYAATHQSGDTEQIKSEYRQKVNDVLSANAANAEKVKAYKKQQ